MINFILKIEKNCRLEAKRLKKCQETLWESYKNITDLEILYFEKDYVN